jgi:hypothetical protein
LHLEKARESSLLAVEAYNKPATHFKSYGYIVLMTMAWTALFHAIFFMRKTKPFYKKENGRYIKQDGDCKHWELCECLRQYYGPDTQNPVRRNLELFIPLRNKIEHRHLPQLDPTIFGECQAMLLNFDDALDKHFGPKYRIRESLSFTLQLFPRTENLGEAVRRHSGLDEVLSFVEQFRSTISTDAQQSGKFAFKAFLIQVANHKSANALPIQYVNYDKLDPSERNALDKFAVFVKLREHPVANANTFKAGYVVREVQKALGNPKVQRIGREVDKFNLHVHLLCWRKHGIRPAAKDPKPELTNPLYCRLLAV